MASTGRAGKAEQSRAQLTLFSGRSRPKENGMDFYDYNLLAVVVLLTCFGLVMLYSVSAYEASITYKNDMYFFTKQAGLSAISLLVLPWFSRVFDYHVAAKLSPIVYVVSMVLLVATKFIGRTINGARRWIYIGSISFQPAELAKVAIIIFLPTIIIREGRRFRKFKVPAAVSLYGIVMGIFTYYFTDNLSTGIIIIGITMVLIYIAHPKPDKLVGVFVAMLVSAALMYFVLKTTGAGGAASSASFRINRIRVWLDPEGNQSGGGYQVMQALYAIGSGGLFGKGLGNSTQKLGALPEAQNDMIFSIICEELGIVGAMIVIFLFVFMLYRLFFIATNAPDLLGSLITIGIFAHISIQVILNIAVVLNVIPTTGITLPFVSYGGTSIVFLMMEMMLALSVSSQIRARGRQ